MVRMGLLPDMQNCRLRMSRECRERFPRHRLHRKPLVSEPGMHHGTCVTHVSWCMLGSLIRGSGENVPGIPSACATRNLGYLVRGPLHKYHNVRMVSAIGVFQCIISAMCGNEATRTYYQTITLTLWNVNSLRPWVHICIYELRQPRMLCCHCMPPGSLHVLGAVGLLS